MTGRSRSLGGDVTGDVNWKEAFLRFSDAAEDIQKMLYESEVQYRYGTRRGYHAIQVSCREDLRELREIMDYLGDDKGEDGVTHSANG